ncbi:MAG: hypothetical protein MRK01_07825 [Candidatus Scalindua sp.]|nr:hypothetical protein [Candidatus Scalindua sp.]
MFTSLSACNKSEEIKDAEKSPSFAAESDPGENSLKNAMKKTSRDVRRLSKALEKKDWVEIEMWAEELKRGIGASCVNLYIKNHSGASGEFIILGDRFYNAANKLTISCQNHDIQAAHTEFNMMLKSCDDCHEGYKESREAGSKSIVN